ncbi:alpha/beta fold hydrolase [Erwinia sp. SLM-02]|uniref:alpha/beta fold hydrolase n=1 Tax=Erwinia sp. SLM-02 TaxID=3020057 RepID=UPI00308053E6
MTQNEHTYTEKRSATAVVNAYFAAFAQGNIAEATALLADDVVWHIDGDPRVSTTGLLRGPEQVRGWLERFPDHFKPEVFAINQLIEHNNSVLAIGRFRHTVLSTGNTIGSDMIIHFTVADSKIARYQIFEDSALLQRAFDASDSWQDQQIKINGTLYRYRDCGEGPTLLFAHGLLVDRDVFAAQVRVLSRTHRCIVLDMPGHGQSGFRPDGWTLDDISGDLALMIRELSLGKVTFIGQSQGGMVGIRLAARDPDCVAGLILIGTSARAEYPERLEQWQAQREVILNGSDEQRASLFADIQRRLNGQRWLTEHPVDVKRERAVMLGHSRTGLALALDAAVFTRGDIRALLPLISVPTLIISGESDRATPPALSAEMAQAIPDATLRTLAETGHHPTIESADAVTQAVVSFLFNNQSGNMR